MYEYHVDELCTFRSNKVNGTKVVEEIQVLGDALTHI